MVENVAGTTFDRIVSTNDRLLSIDGLCINPIVFFIKISTMQEISSFKACGNNLIITQSKVTHIYAEITASSPVVTAR